MARKSRAQSLNRNLDRSSRTQKPQVPSPILVPLEHLRPTQVSVGMRSVEAKRRKISRRVRNDRAMHRFLEARPIPAVRGPGQTYYIIDRHHLSVALLQNEVRRAFVHVIDDLSNLAPKRFWRVMEQDGRLYPFDDHGKRVDHIELPQAITELRHDPYRDLAWSVRERKGFKKCREPFAEFVWADFFRRRISRSLLLRDYKEAVKQAVKIAKSEAACGLPGYTGP